MPEIILYNVYNIIIFLIFNKRYWPLSGFSGIQLSNCIREYIMAIHTYYEQYSNPVKRTLDIGFDSS